MNVGTLTISLTARTASLAKAGAQVKIFESGIIASVQRINASIVSVGMAFSALTIPVAAIGIGATKMFAEFEFSLAKVEGLVGIAHEQTMQWGAEVLELSKTIGRSANEMGEALYFVSSAGIRGAETMEIVKASAQAAAAGMGESKVIANLLTSVMNAYGVANITTARAMDTLVTAVREGKVEATDLIPALGKVLPISSAMGASFNEVGAAIAAMTRTGTPARTAGMMVQRMLFSLQKPSMDAKKAIKGMGTSFENLRDIIKTKKGGILKVLLELKRLTEEPGNLDQMARIFPNIRAYLPALDLLGKNLQKNKTIWMSMLEPAGNFKVLLEATGSTFQKQFANAVNAAGEALIQLGHTFAQTLLPIIQGFAQKMRDFSSWWTGLPRDVQQLIVKVTLLSGVLGPLFIILSAVVGVLTTFSSFIIGIVASVVSLTGVVIGLGVGLLVVVTNLDEWKRAWPNILDHLVVWNTMATIKILKAWDFVTSIFRDMAVFAGVLPPISPAQKQIALFEKDLKKAQDKLDADPDAYTFMDALRDSAINLKGELQPTIDKLRAMFMGVFNVEGGDGAGSFPGGGNVDKAEELRKKMEMIAKSGLFFGPKSRNIALDQFNQLINVVDDTAGAFNTFEQVYSAYIMDAGRLRDTSIEMGDSFDYSTKKLALLNSLISSMEGMELMYSPEQLAIMKEIYAQQEKLLAQQKAVKKTEEIGVKLMQAWKTAGNALVSVFQELGNIIGGAFGEAIDKITPYISLVTKLLTLAKALGVIEDLNTAKKIASTVATGAGIPVVLGAAAAQGVLAEANAAVAITGAAASVSWIPIVGIGLAIAGVIAMIAILSSSKSKATGMAEGGIIPSGYANDSFPAMLSTNEAVIPLDKLPQLVDMNKGNQKQKVVFVIKGRTIEGLMENQNDLNKSF